MKLMPILSEEHLDPSWSEWGKKSCVIGYDGRLSSTGLAVRLVNGLLESGINVIDVGLVPTPVVYFAIHQSENGCGGYYYSQP